jgi:hypothetical protein
MSDKISINVFSRKSISDALSLLQKKQDEIEGNYQRTVEQLTQIGYEYMMSIVKIDSGELAESISWEYDAETNTGRIRVGSSYAIFVEYGTGVVGAANPHPQPAEGWTYDVNSHGEAGWSYWDDKRQRYFHTKGQPASAFVYRTMEYMKSQAGKVLQVNFRGVG